MKTRTLLFRAFQVIILATSIGQVHGQVFIPSLEERQALNTLIPGIVDGAGIMDTLNPAIAGLDTATIVIAPDLPVPVEFVGLQYLDSLRT